MKTKRDTLEDIDFLQDYLWHIDAHISYHEKLGEIRELIVKTEPKEGKQ